MATYAFVLNKHKVKVKPEDQGKTKKTGLQSIDLRVTIDRRPRTRTTGFHVNATEWDAGKERVKQGHENATHITDALLAIKAKAQRVYADAVAAGQSPTSDEVLERTFATTDFHAFATATIAAMDKEDRVRTAKKFTTMHNHLKAFAPSLKVEAIDARFVEGFRAYLLARRIGRAGQEEPMEHNSIVNTLHTFRALYNMSPQRRTPSPFVGAKIGSYRPSGTEPLTAAEITALWNYEPDTASNRRARDLFLFSYYALGMRIGDVLRLEWEAVRDLEIVYTEGKKKRHGSRAIRVPRNRFIDAILSRWPRKGAYVFNQITAKTERDIQKQIESVEAAINRSLKTVAAACGIAKWIASKLARTTFADIANKRTGRNVYAVQQAMGHSRISTTEIYLGKDASAIDELVALVYGEN